MSSGEQVAGKRITSVQLEPSSPMKPASASASRRAAPRRSREGDSARGSHGTSTIRRRGAPANPAGDRRGPTLRAPPDTIIGDRPRDGNMSCLSAGAFESPLWQASAPRGGDRRSPGCLCSNARRRRKRLQWLRMPRYTSGVTTKARSNAGRRINITRGAERALVTIEKRHRGLSRELSPPFRLGSRRARRS
jgi:hypothetical protein